MKSALIIILSILFHWLIILLLSPFLIGLIAKVKAVVAGKKGPPVFQLYFDLIKLLRKRSVYSRSATWVFRITPMVVFAVMLIVALFIPLGGLKAPVQFAGDIILVAYFFAMARFFMILAALDTGSSFEGMGASREAFFACLSELALFMNFITLSCLTRSISLSTMIGVDVPIFWSSLGPALLLVVASFFVILLAENCRIPVDDPDTHLELTMIHEVMILDHSGVDLAYLVYASAIKLCIFTALLVSIIFPMQAGYSFWNMLLFFAGALGLAVLVGIVESSMARIRLNRVRNLLLISFVLGFFGFIVTLWRI